jgi:hypothetical protein
MAYTGFAAFDTTVDKTNHVLRRIEQAFGWSKDQRKALLTFLWVGFHDRPGSGGQRPPRVRSAMAISDSGLW